MNQARRGAWAAFLFVVVCGILYVSQAWSPSSYGVMLRQMGAANAGLVFGEPRPIRSDEWAVVTPLTQATVRNGFERFNKTSLYQEDLRINYGLPVMDWGMLFKPTMLPYLWADAAHAYSFHWYATLVLFLAGHALLFARVGLSPPLAILLSVGLYFTPFAQFWWNEKGPVLAFFPWVMLALLAPWHRALRLLLCYWLGASWLITNFYPPLFISLGFVGACLLLAFDREWFRPGRLAALALSAGAAGATAAFYLKDYLLATAATVYPGGRSVTGGGVPWYEWWAALFPFSTFDWRYESLRGDNICEVGAVGAAFVLLAVCCLRYETLKPILSRGSDWRTPLCVLGAGLLLMAGWMATPLPAWAGAPLLWNHVQPERMEYAFGLMLMLLVALLIDKAELRFSAWRLAAYASVVVVAWMVLKGYTALEEGVGIWRLRISDLVVLPALLLALLGMRLWHWRPPTVALAASAISGAVVLFGFNPIQSAKPIFAAPSAEQRAIFEAELTDGGKGPVAIEGMFGATVNGLGFGSVSHVTPVPALDFWRKRYPEMPEAEFMAVFNRYSHIRLNAGYSGPPRSEHLDAVTLPLADFWPLRVYLPKSSAPPLRPAWVNTGQQTRGRLVLTRGGEVEEVRVFIGTSQGRADGQMQLRMCQAQRCSTGVAPLQGARDNAYLRLRLNVPLLMQEGQPLDYEFSVVGGQHPVALWLHQSAEGEGQISLPEEAVHLSPRFEFSFAIRP